MPRSGRSGTPGTTRDGAAYWASMRPGQSCPGVAFDPSYTKTVGVSNARFNEAGAIMPRSGRESESLHTPPALSPCFNEAGAIMPRSGQHSQIAASTVGRVVSFNEAGAIMPRSGQIAPRRCVLSGPPGASMRPGQSCPGVACQGIEHWHG